MSSPTSFITQLLQTSDGNQLVHVMRQSHDYNINEEAAPETFLDLLFVKAEALAFGPTSTRLVVELINHHLSHFKDAKFASNNINLLCRICDFLFLTLLPRKLEICKTYGFNSNHECSDLFAIFELITKKIIQKNNLDPTITCSRPIIKTIVEVLFQFVNDFDGSADEFRRSLSNGGAIGQIIHSLSIARDACGTDAYSRRSADCWYFLAFGMIGRELSHAIERSEDSANGAHTKQIRIARVATIVVEIIKKFLLIVGIWLPEGEKQEKMREWSNSRVASSIARNKQFWKGIQSFLYYGASNFTSNDTSSANSYSSLLSSLVECLSFIVPKSDNVNHLIVGEEFVLSITSAPVVHFVCQQNNDNRGRQSYRNETLTHYLILLCNIAKVKPSSFRSIIMKEETGVVPRLKEFFDTFAGRCEYDSARSLSTAFLWFGLIVDDFYKNDVENSKNVSIDDIVLSRVANSEQQLHEDQQDKIPQPIGESNSASSHPFAIFIKHFCNTVLTNVLQFFSSYSSWSFDIFDFAFGLDVLLRNFFPAGKRITWPDLTESSVGLSICRSVAESCREVAKDIDEKPSAPQVAFEYVVEMSRVFNRLDSEYWKAYEAHGCEDAPPSFYFHNSVQFSRFLLSNRSQLPQADRLEILKLIDHVTTCDYWRRSASLWARTDSEWDQTFMSLLRLMELSVLDSVPEFELVSRILSDFLRYSHSFHPPATSVLLSLGRTFRRMDGPAWATAFLNVIGSMDSMVPILPVSRDDAVNVELFSVLADMFPLIVTTANKVLQPSENGHDMYCDELFDVVWNVFRFLTFAKEAKISSMVDAADIDGQLSVFYRPEFVSVMIIVLDSAFWENSEAFFHCCQMLVGLHERCDSLGKRMDAFAQNNRFFCLLHGNMQKINKSAIEDSWDIGDEFLDVYQQVCTVVLKKNESEIIMPQRREREEE